MRQQSSREKELKFEISEKEYQVISEYYGAPSVTVGTSVDSFWTISADVEAFLRHRASTGQFEVKVQDKGGVQDRLELVLDPILIVKPPEFLLTKYDVRVWYGDVEVCLYYVFELDQYFLEYEGTTFGALWNAADRLEKDLGIELQLMDKSLFKLGKEKYAKDTAGHSAISGR